MGFNKEQQEAIDTPVQTNVLISAGAGSGKTKTLSQKVLKLVLENHIDPSSILVLTFTDAAAFEMKDRIIKIFREKSEDPSLADKIFSAHIQTFDSFSLYLVKKYSDRLGLADSVAIIDEDILNAKRQEILEEILSEKYQEKDPKVLSTLKKFNSYQDRKTVQVLLDLDDQLNKMMPDQKKAFMEEYSAHYLDKDFLTQKSKEFADKVKEKVREDLQLIYFWFCHQGESPDKLIFEAKKPHAFDGYPNVSFSDNHLNEFYAHFLKLTAPELSYSDFIAEIGSTLAGPMKNKKAIEKVMKDAPAEEIDVAELLLSILTGPKKGSILGQQAGIRYLATDFADFETQVRTIQSFKEDIGLFFSLLQEMNQRLWNYKRVTNTYCFADVANLALSLLTEERFADVRKEIQDRFRYILVDEYQDTNDFQELFLNSISAHSTLFTVGDAKQAIYGFRNSNCQLFIDRKEKYQKDGNPDKERVIEMNTNYRSVAKVLEDINLIFSGYMSKDHGGIAYEGKELLAYDAVQDIYPKDELYPQGEYGVHLLSYHGFHPEAQHSAAQEEALIILDDILNKVRNHYQVIDTIKDHHLLLRDCRFSDFAILIRKKKNFSLYRRVFSKYNVPLNDEEDDHLSNVDAILALESLIRLLSDTLGYSKENRPHLFASLARSYLFGREAGYDDEKIYEILSDASGKKLDQDPILLKVKGFASRNKDLTFSAIYRNLLTEFGFIAKLPTVGNVSANITKIESLYRIVLNQEAVGEGLKEFIALFRDMNRYEIDLSSSTVIAVKDAVEIASIHKSKGLEYKIIYLPITDNCIASGGPDQADYSFSKKLGLILPNYRLGEKVSTFLSPAYSWGEGNGEENVNEHVRLFYVALTRAKETLYIVGKEPKTNQAGKENLFAMLSKTPNCLELREDLIAPYIQGGVVPLSDLSQYQADKKIYLDSFDPEMRKPADGGEDEKKIYHSFYERFIQDPLQQKVDADVSGIADKIYQNLVDRLLNADLPTVLYVFSSAYCGTDERISIQEMIGQFSAILTQMGISMSEEGIIAWLHRMVNAIVTGKTEFFSSKKDLSIEDFFFAPLLLALDGISDPIAEVNYSSFTERFFSKKAIITPYEHKKDVKMDYPLNDDVITFTPSHHRRASKFVSDEEGIHTAAKEKGLYFHELLELTDFKTKDTSFIQNPGDRLIIDKVLALPVFQGLEEATVYHEYGYYDTDEKVTGFIDCLIVRKDSLTLIDYKLKNLSDPAYDRQLATYERNLNRLFPGLPVKKYLLSILDGSLLEK